MQPESSSAVFMEKFFMTPVFMWPALGRCAREKFLCLRVLCVTHPDTNSRAFNGNTDDITFTVHCLDDARATRIVAEDLAKPADAHVDAAIERACIATARELE